MKIDKYEYPDEFLYYIADPGHLWIRRLTNSIQIGIDDFSQDLAGKISFVRIKKEGAKVSRGTTIGTFETTKWVGPIKTPVDGTIAKRNQVLVDRPEIINEKPNESWIVEIAVDDVEKQLNHPDIVPVGEKLKRYVLSEIREHRDTLE